MSGPAAIPTVGLIAVTLEVDVPAEAVAIFVHAVEADADAFGERLVKVAGEADTAIAVPGTDELGDMRRGSTAWSPG